MSPKQKNIVVSSPRTDSRASGMTASTLPVYPGSPPPSYSRSNPQYAASSAGSSYSSSSSSSKGGKGYFQPSPYTGYASPTNAPVMQAVDLPFVQDSMPPAQLQSIADVLLKPNTSWDFSNPSGLPSLESLGPATVPLLTSFPLTFEFDERVFDLQREKGIRIHEILQFIYSFLQEPFVDSPSTSSSDSQPSPPPPRRRLDTLGDRTKFGGLRLSTVHKSQHIWLVQFISC